VTAFTAGANCYWINLTYNQLNRRYVDNTTTSTATASVIRTAASTAAYD
jgi:hypothetical protein